MLGEVGLEDGKEGRKEGGSVRRRLPKEIESEVSVFRCLNCYLSKKMATDGLRDFDK